MPKNHNTVGGLPSRFCGTSKDGPDLRSVTQPTWEHGPRLTMVCAHGHGRCSCLVVGLVDRRLTCVRTILIRWMPGI
eukprot:8438144-Heterocapsa_arctica.AAC.1